MSSLQEVGLFETPRALSPARESNSDDTERVLLLRRFSDKLILNPHLTRALVSFQANKTTPFYRWFKYKEAFSSDFVKYVIQKFMSTTQGTPQVLDPFAGAGTTLTTSTKAGWRATGVELLPVGIAAMRARLRADLVDTSVFQRHLARLDAYSWIKPRSRGFRFPHLRITEKAFPEETERDLTAYIRFLNDVDDEHVRYLFWFACLSILEDVSYTRKDGQYLRWDSRSGRCLKSIFDKGPIPSFRTAITRKLTVMLEDIQQRNGGTFSSNVEVLEGSCLNKLAELPDASFHLVLTSPPYCNRYDYTRTYALELAFLGHDEAQVRNLRQTLLSATVENKSKRRQLQEEYAVRGQRERYDECLNVFTNQAALQEVLRLLYEARDSGKLNNDNVPNMVENYFFEMNFVIYELARLLEPGGKVVMVNDNVRYAGEEVPVDLILSDFALKAGLDVDHIWVLPTGKGNSSQQMGEHGRKEMRKCVYIWSKP